MFEKITAYFFLKRLGVGSIVIIVCSSFFSSCSFFSKTTSLSVSIPPTSVQLIPIGWFRLVGKTVPPQFLLYIVKEDYSTVLTVKEFIVPPHEQSILNRDNLLVIGNISWQTKLADGKEIQMVYNPTIIEKKNSLCTYTYSEKKLLRRVAVFRKEKRSYEVELLQLKVGEPFSSLTVVQDKFVQSFIDVYTK